MDLLQLALIIITVVGCVHVVYERGKQAGISEGRQQILKENLERAQIDKRKFDDSLKMAMSNL